MTFAVEAREIRKSFGGVEVLHGVDLDSSAGSVLALLGENGAGKSTLVKIMAGVHEPDSGQVIIDGEAHPSLNPRQARDLGIAIISQEYQDAPTLTVAENISLGRLSGRGGLVAWNEVRNKARNILKELDVDIDVEATVSRLRVGERQIVEIARALSTRARLLILDEPTAALSHHEAEVLFDFVRRLRDQGVAIVYITHRLDEVGQISDRVQVLRDGRTSLVGDVTDTTRSEMIEAMIGRKASDLSRPPAPGHEIADAPAVRWVDATVHGAFRDINMHVRTGEVVAIYGKLGSGAAEIGETAFGIRGLDRGRIEIDGHEVHVRNPVRAIGRGVGFLPAERKAGGAFLVRSVAENVAVASWPRLAKFRHLITERTEAKAYRRWHDRLSIRSRNDPRQVMGTLSGGNQQKVLLSRWLERHSQALLLVEPTRGVDVGAREDIYTTLRKLAATGVSVLVITSDYEEALQVADRAYIMAKGQLAGELQGDEVTTNKLLELAGG